MFGAIAASADAVVKIGDARHEGATTTEALAEGGGGEQEYGEGQGVGVDRPLEARESGVEVHADDGQRRGHDEVVERRHEEREAGDEHGPRAAVIDRPAGAWPVRAARCRSAGSVWWSLRVLLALAPPSGNS